MAKYPKKIASIVTGNMIYEAWKVQSLMEKLSDPLVKSHEFTSTHS